MSTVSPDLVKDYLFSKGETSAAIEWKYFDNTFNNGRERGFVYLYNGKVAGFMGLIPFTVRLDTQVIESAWSCDWYREPHTPGPMGIMLIKASLRSYKLIYSLGGNQTTKLLLTKLSQKAIADAGIVFYKPLRLGGVLKPAARKIGYSFLESVGFLNAIPLLNVRKGRSSLATIHWGVSRDASTVMIPPSDARSLPLYDLNYVDWQVGRCPALISATCISRLSTSPRAALFFWRTVDTVDFWRIAIISQVDAYEEIDDILTSVLEHIYQHGGSLISVLISRLDLDLHRLLKAKGFVAGARRPLYILTSDSKGPTEELQRLSFLDTDWAYRFPYIPAPAPLR